MKKMKFSCTQYLLAALVPIIGLSACGLPNESIAIDIVYRQHNDGSSLKIASAIHVDSAGTIWQATHAAQISPSIAPDDIVAQSSCFLVAGNPRTSNFTDYRALDLGEVIIESNGHEFILEPRDLMDTEGIGFRIELEVSDLAYVPDRKYTVKATGAQESPGFESSIEAPPSFQIDKLNGIKPTVGSIPIHKKQDLEIQWSPTNGQGAMFIALTTSNQALVCRAEDKGRFKISNKTLSKIEKKSGDLILERYKEESFETSPGADNRSRKGRIRYSVQQWQKFDFE